MCNKFYRVCQWDGRHGADRKVDSRSLRGKLKTRFRTEVYRGQFDY